jgi:hypothetical protein
MQRNQMLSKLKMSPAPLHPESVWATAVSHSPHATVFLDHVDRIFEATTGQPIAAGFKEDPATANSEILRRTLQSMARWVSRDEVG